MKATALLILMLAACDHPGELGEPCKPDGTCSASGLTCLHMGTTGTGAPYMRCMITPAPEKPKSCSSDADCFCETCLKRCGDVGVKLCAYSDVSVWGSKPTVCECRQ